MKCPIIYPTDHRLQKSCEKVFEKYSKYSKEPKLYDLSTVNRTIEKAPVGHLGREFTLGQKIVLVREWLKSGLSPSDFRKSHEISEDSLLKWLKDYNSYFIPYTLKKQVPKDLLKDLPRDREVLEKFNLIIEDRGASERVHALVDEIMLFYGSNWKMRLSPVEKKVISNCWIYVRDRGEVKKDFCTKHGLSLWSLSNWQSLESARLAHLTSRIDY